MEQLGEIRSRAWIYIQESARKWNVRPAIVSRITPRHGDEYQCSGSLNVHKIEGAVWRVEVAYYGVSQHLCETCLLLNVLRDDRVINFGFIRHDGQTYSRFTSVVVQEFVLGFANNMDVWAGSHGPMSK